MEEKEFLCKIIENNPGGSYFCEESACEMCRVIMPKQMAFSLSLPKTHGHLTLWKESYTHTPQKYAITPLYFMESKVSKNHLQILKIMHIGTLKQLPL